MLCIKKILRICYFLLKRKKLLRRPNTYVHNILKYHNFKIFHDQLLLYNDLIYLEM